MTISDRRQLLLRHGAGKRPRSTLSSGNGSDLGFKHRQVSSAWSFGFETGPKSGRIATLESANGKSQFGGIGCRIGRMERSDGHERWSRLDRDGHSGTLADRDVINGKSKLKGLEAGVTSFGSSRQPNCGTIPRQLVANGIFPFSGGGL